MHKHGDSGGAARSHELISYYYYFMPSFVLVEGGPLVPFRDNTIQGKYSEWTIFMHNSLFEIGLNVFNEGSSQPTGVENGDNFNFSGHKHLADNLFTTDSIVPMVPCDANCCCYIRASRASQELLTIFDPQA